MLTQATKRRFEYVAGTSDKFWEIEVTGREVTVRFGRNGSSGQTTRGASPTFRMRTSTPSG